MLPDGFTRFHPPLKMHHVGIVERSEAEARAKMALLSLEEDYRGYVPQWSCLCIFTEALGGSAIEFVIPQGGPLAAFNKGAGGIHHIAFEVSDLDALAQSLRGVGVELLEREHVRGAGPFLCNFLSPVYTRGLAIEYVQPLVR